MAKIILMTLISIILSFNTTATELNKKEKIMTFKIEKIDLTVTDMNKMHDFYKSVFSIQFTAQEFGPHTIFTGDVPGLYKLQLVPKELTGNESKQNRHQFNFRVSELDRVIKLTQQHGGTQVGEIEIHDGLRYFSVKDPDQNFIVFSGK